MFEKRLDHWRNIIIAKELNVNLSSVFTREETNSLPVPQKQSSKDQRGKGLGS